MEDQAFPIQYQANCPYFRTRLFLQPILKIPSHSKTLCAFGTSTREKRSAGNCSFIPKQGVYTTERSLSLSLFRLSPRRSNANSAFRSPLAGFFYTPSITGNYRVTILPLEPRLINCRLTSLGTACAG